MSVVGVDIGGSHITCGIVSRDGSLLKESIVNRKTFDKQGIDLIHEWSTAINNVIEKNPNEDLVGIGIAIPGPVDYQHGVAYFDGSNSKFQSLYKVDIKSELLKALDYKSEIRFVNDAVAFGIGENWVGEAKGFGCSLAITLGTGFGSTIFKDNQPQLKGASVPKNGCFWHLPFKDGIADDYFSTRWLVKRYNELRGTQVEGVKEIAEVFDSCAYSRKAFDEFGEMLGEFLLPWLSKLEIEALILGGNISRAISCFEKPLQSFLAQKNQPLIIKKSELRESAALIGSARIHKEDYWQSLNDQIAGATF